MNKITNEQIKNLSNEGGLEYAVLKAFIEVESGGKGFDEKTGKLLIQFEPAWFKKQAPFVPSGQWSLNKVDVQSKEWPAFNDAFGKDPDAAMKSTSIGLPQIMGFHYKRLGYATVGQMWEDFKKGEFEQVSALVRFIRTDNKLFAALQRKDWHQVATIYNGAAYRQMAIRWKREPYNISLEKAYKKYENK
ncbi:MAG: N-acetylmuramidase domain-containing protein [Taibaiella sp.]|jgi:hypothetical protein